MPFEKGKSGNPNGRPIGGVGKARAALAEVIEKRLPVEKRIDLIASLAEGVYVEREILNTECGSKGKKIKVAVFKRPPDFAALVYLTDQSEGKAPQRSQVNGGLSEEQVDALRSLAGKIMDEGV